MQKYGTVVAGCVAEYGAVEYAEYGAAEVAAEVAEYGAVAAGCVAEYGAVEYGAEYGAAAVVNMTAERSMVNYGWWKTFSGRHCRVFKNLCSDDSF